ncbi:hypothetical protein VTH82DRAFT_5340 [Thermothelomyces myriococcoides]
MAENVTKKSLWARFLTWATHSKKPSAKPTGKPLFRPSFRRPLKAGKDNKLGNNWTYYRKTFLLLDKQTQFDLYVAGLAPKMRKSEAKKFKSQIRTRRVCRRFKKVPVVYAVEEPPFKQAVSSRKPVKKAAKEAQPRASGSSNTNSDKNSGTKNSNNNNNNDNRKGKAKMTKNTGGASLDNTDSLPAHPTPAAFNRMSKKPETNRLAPTSGRARMQQKQKQQQQHQGQGYPQANAPQAADRRKSAQPNGQARVSQATAKTQTRGSRPLGQRTAGQTVASSSRC